MFYYAEPAHPVQRPFRFLTRHFFLLSQDALIALAGQVRIQAKLFHRAHTSVRSIDDVWHTFPFVKGNAPFTKTSPPHAR